MIFLVKEIPLQNGMVALVDDEDYERVNQHTWTVSVQKITTLYVHSNLNGRSKEHAALSRYVLGLTKSDKTTIVTFKDGNHLNCQKSNLLKTTKLNVAARSRGNRNSTSKYKGVSYCKQTSKWKAQIRIKGKQTNLGRFKSEEEAAEVYNKKAFEYFGEFAYLNIMGEDNNASEILIEKQKQNRSKNKTSFRGVSKQGCKFRAEIRSNKRKYYLGVFETAEDAAKAYDKKAYELHGDKVILNFPENVGEYIEKS